MRTAILFVIVLLPTSLFAQEADSDLFKLIKPDDVWQRFETLEDGIAEINTTTVAWGMYGEDRTGRVAFRYIYDHPKAVPGDAKLKFKTELFIVELNCFRSAWRTMELHYLDSSQKVVHSQRGNAETKWHPGGVPGSRYVAIGCKVISNNSGDIIKSGNRPLEVEGPPALIRRPQDDLPAVPNPPVLKPKAEKKPE